ncbi:MAG TPA: hypothetical protein VGQ00_03515 [Candidatus Norongarragalinales archaeon]|nr:hypothetical protein [Candidatus Norongarragalinales archaeon]
MLNLKSRGQVGLEYAGVLVLVLVVLAPVLFFALQQMQSQAASQQALVALTQMASAADSVAVAGEGSVTSLRVFFPDFIVNSSATHIQGREFAMGLSLPTGNTEVYATSKVNVSGVMPLTPGAHSFNFSMNSSGAVTVAQT